MGISLILSSCYDPKNALVKTPDFKLMECRVYLVVQSKPELVFEHKETLPIEACNGIWGVEPKEMAAITREWNAHWKKEEAKKDK